LVGDRRGNGDGLLGKLPIRGASSTAVLGIGFAVSTRDTL
jgi:hypothetical protein